MNIKGIITAKSLTINDYTLRLEPADGGVQISIIRGNEIQTEFIPDGLSPEFSVETVEGGHMLTVTDAAGTREYFLPDAALPEGGEPGQILTRTEDGGAGWQNPPKGFSGDYNDLENRPVSADVKEIDIEWDGVVPADADSFEIGTSGIMYYKFSDEVPDIERIISAYAETSTGKTGGDILQGGNCYQITPSSVAAVLVVTEAGACTRPKGDSFTAPSTGVYLYHVSSQHTTKCQIEYEDVQQLDEKFIPGSIARVDDIPDAVKTVNGNAPDETGNVEVPAMPAADGAFKQLVTGADGVAQWEERTHYVDELNITWDGGTENRESFILETEDPALTFYKVSNEIISADKFIGATMTVSGADQLGMPAQMVIEADAITSDEGVACIQFILPLVYSFDAIRAAELGAPTAGTYVLLAKADDISAMLGNTVEDDLFASSLTNEQINKLDNKFLQSDVLRYGAIGEVTRIEWDGNTDGLESFKCNGFSYYKVSDTVIPFRHLASATSKRSDSPKAITEAFSGINCYVLRNAIVVTQAGSCTTSEGFKFTANSEGIYFWTGANMSAWCDWAEFDTRRENSKLYLTNPSGVEYAITVDDDGNLSAYPTK